MEGEDRDYEEVDSDSMRVMRMFERKEFMEIPVFTWLLGYAMAPQTRVKSIHGKFELEWGSNKFFSTFI